MLGGDVRVAWRRQQGVLREGDLGVALGECAHRGCWLLQAGDSKVGGAGFGHWRVLGAGAGGGKRSHPIEVI